MNKENNWWILKTREIIDQNFLVDIREFSDFKEIRHNNVVKFVWAKSPYYDFCFVTILVELSFSRRCVHCYCKDNN